MPALVTITPPVSNVEFQIFNNVSRYTDFGTQYGEEATFVAPIQKKPLGERFYHRKREGHAIIALIAEANMNPAALDRTKAILGGQSVEDVASWADDYRRDHREIGPWALHRHSASGIRHRYGTRLPDWPVRHCPD